jgi:hypothetical protein
MIRVFPRRTKWTPDDEFAFVGDPPFFRPPEMPVKVSVTFTWDIPEAQRLQKAWSQYYKSVLIGGPALDDTGDEFEPGMFVKEGVIETSRGCPKKCEWCFVPSREGQIRELKIKEGYIVIDNNLLACSKSHLAGVFLMLSVQKKAAQFKGGLDSTLFQPWHKSLFDSIRVDEMFFACDTAGAIKPLEGVANLLSGMSIEKKRCFVMIGRNESIEEAERRLKEVYGLGFLPFAQLYQPKKRIQYSKEWLDLNRKWSRPAAFRGTKMLKGD